MKKYGSLPRMIGNFGFDLTEVMHYLYLPVAMRKNDYLSDIKLPPNVRVCYYMIVAAQMAMIDRGLDYDYVYLTARKGWASPDNPLNRPGWHCDGFGTDDMNYIWWSGPGTRFAIQDFTDISDNHIISLRQFDNQVQPENIVTYKEKTLLELDPFCVHATPLISAPGCWRQFVKISFSKSRYNLENNSHNHMFDYDWPLHSREELRNDPARAQADFVR